MRRLIVRTVAALFFVSPALAEQGPSATPSTASTPATTPDVGVPADSAPIASRGRSSGAWTLSAVLSRRHDDNILQLPRNDLDRLTSNPTPPRFLVETPADDITELGLEAGYRMRVLPRRETRVQASVDMNRYQRNTVMNWEEYELAWRQELTASRRTLSTLKMWGNVRPRYYLGQITDADDSFAAGRRIRRSLTFSQTEVGLRLAQRLPGRLALAVGGELLRRDYESHFDERDNDNAQWRLVADVQPFRVWGMSAGVTSIAGRLDARGDLVASPIRDTDISYDHHGLGAELRVPWELADHDGRIQVSWMREARRYTTSDKFDLKRFGRTNHRDATSVRLTQHVWGPVDVIASYDRLTSDATFPDGIVFDADATDFQQTRWGLMLRTLWPHP